MQQSQLSLESGASMIRKDNQQKNGLGRLCQEDVMEMPRDEFLQFLGPLLHFVLPHLGFTFLCLWVDYY